MPLCGDEYGFLPVDDPQIAALIGCAPGDRAVIRWYENEALPEPLPDGSKVYVRHGAGTGGYRLLVVDGPDRRLVAPDGSVDTTPGAIVGIVIDTLAQTPVPSGR